MGSWIRAYARNWAPAIRGEVQQYRRLSARRGRKRAAVAVGHTVLGIIFQVLKAGSVYRDLGPEYLERLEPERLTRQLVRRLERLGHKVTLEANDEAA